ncbi:MAG TPA: sigma 54-interacting transcriptional regulator [Candidatus Babeliales bacterium]|nr:sigma 54-interacting transcriptional regulator [Candidatus Babeliales bacterium]
MRSAIVGKHFYFLLAIIVGNMFSDFAWMMKLSKILFLSQLDYKLVLFFVRIAWIFFIIQYQALALFIENLVIQKYTFPLRQKLFCSISGAFCMFFAAIAVLDFDCPDQSQRFYLEPMLQDFSILYVLIPLILPSVYVVLKEIRFGSLPFILRRQLSIFVKGLIIPLLVADFVQMCPFKIRSLEILAHNYAAVGFTTILLTLAIYFCAKKIFGLRFLNLKDHVQQPMNINFVDDFKGVLERLSSVTNFRELGHITQNFFKDTFSISFTRTRLYLRQIDTPEYKSQFNMIEDRTVSLIETFLVTHADIIEHAIKEEKILIYDEIDFTHFYHACEKSEIILKFLSTINADIFLPIHENDKLIAYIIVERHARAEKFYSNVERDELIVFGSYLGNIINLLQNKSLDILIEQAQHLRADLYQKHQEIEQYKESIRSFLRKSKTKHIGILFYKSRQFSYGNQAAKELIDININQQHGHPLAQSLRQLAQQVESFKGPKTIFVKDSTDNTLVISAVPHLEKNTIIITVSYPSISDAIKHHIDLLKDPSEWDYLLYLQTTQSGKLINQLIPSSGSVLLNFKVQLLKIALSKKAILLEMPEQDLQPTAEILHHISMRDNLHIMALQGPSHNFDIAIALFGINPIFGVQSKNTQPLLEKLDNVGTLFVKNIHFLDLETQEYLAVFIKTGFYNQFKSDQKISTNVRIICSSNQNLALLVQEGKFSKALFQELKSTVVAMPSLLTLPENELHALTEGFTQQALMSDALQHVLALTDKEKDLFAYNRPVSLQELKARVQHILVKKSKKSQIYQEVSFDPAYDITDPDLVEAARLGKKALKEPRVMVLLWNKFKNQNKIAFFLGVNRSSVNRRCKEYNLL